MPFEIVRNDIVNMQVDAIVNTANPNPVIGSGVDSGIHKHVCRHTYCSNMAKSGMNPKTLQYLMGHSDIAVTLNVYTHIGLDDERKN